MRITAFGKTDKGRRRPNNEDDLAVVDLTEGRMLPDHSAEHLQVGEKGVLLALGRTGSAVYFLYYSAMPRPLRLEAEGAIYHVIARGNERKPIFRDDHDRREERKWGQSCKMAS